MICLCKPTKISVPKTSLSDKPPATADAKVEKLSWSPLTAGPYLVPVTRWIE